MKNSLFVILIIQLFFPTYNFAQSNSKATAIILETTDAEGRAAIAVTVKDLLGQKFVLEIPELFTNKELKGELFNYSKQIWIHRKDGADMTLKDDKYEYTINLDKFKSRKTVGLKWAITFKNNTDENVTDLVAFNCWTMNFSPLFKDVEMKRTFVLDSAGNKISLNTVRKTKGDGRRTMQYYPAKESNVDLYESPWIKQWSVISNQQLSGNTISVLSTDAKWLFENKVKGKVAFFFNNWENDHGCVHASPLLSKKLSPGKSAKASGVFKFTSIK